MASICWALLLFLAMFSALATSDTHSDDNLTLRCHPDQAASLLLLKRSFSFFRYPSGLESWQDDTDCCLWGGVGCRHSPGQGLDPAIFNLTSLQLLDLSMNNFGQCNLPATGFERLSLLTHLNLSNSGFQGQIPIGIGKLANLISLDLSVLYYMASDDSLNGYGTSIPGVTSWLWLQEPNFQILVGNLNNLRELYLDGVDMSTSADDWCDAFADSLPNLRVLSLRYCNLVGPICPSLSTLHSLAVISLQDNFDTSVTSSGDAHGFSQFKFSSACLEKYPTLVP
uniref:Putative LRR receptor-like serine/threonine-protein kinase n=1 Tax=Aegilops tauschii TaxID=37682 RepID=M8B386_AEGTA